MSRPQLSLDLPAILPSNAYDYGTRASGEFHGVVLTKPHVVKLILNLAGYSSDRDLSRFSLLEPACGHGAFLVEAIDRLMISAKLFKRHPRSLANAIVSYDVDAEHVEIARRAVRDILVAHAVSEADAEMLANAWVIHADFLLTAHARKFDFVVGNPPYIRVEQIAQSLQNEYRRLYESLYDRADIYVAFIERSLGLLKDDGVVAFICADRWILNKYGSPLRRLISKRHCVRYYIDLHRASPFDSDVIAYPSIFVMSTGATRRVRVAALETASSEECDKAFSVIRNQAAEDSSAQVGVYDSWFKDDEPWVISTPMHLRALRDLEDRFPALEQSGATVGIGVATGNDRIFIVDESVDIERERLVPLVMREDIRNGAIRDARRFVINGFQEGGALVDLEEYPRLANYLRAHEVDIRKRHVAKKNPQSWFRTIDRVYPALVKTPKLLIPDISGSNEVVLDKGLYHPHHNLYFVSSEKWDMEVLGGLLSSKVALFFVWSYAVRMRGGYLRFQAQYLRRIRVPEAASISAALGASIRNAFRERDFRSLDELALAAYGISELPEFNFVDTRS